MTHEIIIDKIEEKKYPYYYGIENHIQDNKKRITFNCKECSCLKILKGELSCK